MLHHQNRDLHDCTVPPSRSLNTRTVSSGGTSRGLDSSWTSAMSNSVTWLGWGNKREARSEKRIQIRSVLLCFSDLAAVQIRLCKVFGEASWFLQVLTPVLFFSCQTSPPALPQTLDEPGKHGPLVPGPMLTLTPLSAYCAPQYQPSKPLTARPAIRR